MSDDQSEVAGVIVILGAPNDEHGRLSPIAMERCARALEVVRSHPRHLILPTGGWGRHFNVTEQPHGNHVRAELVKQGVAESVFLPCVESSNTIEDAALSGPALEGFPKSEVIVVTSDFHEARARFLFERELPGRPIRLVVSKTVLPTEELARLREHEARALARLRSTDSKDETC